MSGKPTSSFGWKTCFVVGIFAFVLGISIGFFVPFTSSKTMFLSEQREIDEKYTYVSPLLACGENLFDHLGQDETSVLENAIENNIVAMKADGSVSDVGVYFRQLKGGPWIGVNFDAKFTPGSLLKVPLVMSVYKRAQSNPDLLSAEILYEAGDASGRQHFGTDVVAPDSRYSVKELIDHTLIESDNSAALLLAEVVGDERLIDAYRSLGIDTPQNSQDYTTTVRAYAAFFRILYNATYNSAEDSEQILETLTRSVFKEGLVAGIPGGIPVAHKFGERTIDGFEHIQLHDCGIVYHPERPYLLCIMMRGKDFDVLARSIAGLSRLVYESVD